MKRLSFLSLFCLLAVLTVGAAHAIDRPKVEKQFQTWLANDLWPQAKARGISPRNFNAAFKDINLNWKLPDLVPPGTKAKPSRPQAQAEFRSPGRYFNENNIQPVVATGRKLFAKHRKLITRIEKKYGVPGRILLAIWGVNQLSAGLLFPMTDSRYLPPKPLCLPARSFSGRKCWQLFKLSRKVTPRRGQ